jgi:large subunit ribosomal protein L35
MPKMKTYKSLKKRFRVTAKGKLKRRQAGKKHLESHKSGKRKRQLRAPITQDRKLAKKYVRLIGTA